MTETVARAAALLSPIFWICACPCLACRRASDFASMPTRPCTITSSAPWTSAAPPCCLKCSSAMPPAFMAFCHFAFLMCCCPRWSSATALPSASPMSRYITSAASPAFRASSYLSSPERARMIASHASASLGLSAAAEANCMDLLAAFRAALGLALARWTSASVSHNAAAMDESSNSWESASASFPADAAASALFWKSSSSTSA
mmetsp:Transcript_42703/g.127632  ORF Transcript_42703/g.127632 Transcript_42703/m.127632 type:complete len:204 (-) Transcript_42703:321-932(-)